MTPSEMFQDGNPVSSNFKTLEELWEWHKPLIEAEIKFEEEHKASWLKESDCFLFNIIIKLVFLNIPIIEYELALELFVWFFFKEHQKCVG